MLSPKMKYVTIWFNTREYGGPEEGGWWYDTGEPIEIFECTEAEVEQKKAEAEAIVEKRNEGRRPLYSVRSTGRYSVSVEDERPEPYPAETPHYE